jgi:hypothetical protein
VRPSRWLALVAWAALVAAAAGASAGQGGDRWKDLRFLLGKWEGVGRGGPGEGAGAFTFELALDDTVLIRRGHSSYPATKDRPAANHDDLLILYTEGGQLRAINLDNEGHVIHYAVTVSSDGRIVTFVSGPAQGAPRFRFTYTVVDKDTVNGKFEIAPPGKPDAFAVYIAGDARRVK